MTADYNTLVDRVSHRENESPFRLTTKEALDEYLDSRKEEAFQGELVIDTTAMKIEEVAARIKELL